MRTYYKKIPLRINQYYPKIQQNHALLVAPFVELTFFEKNPASFVQNQTAFLFSPNNNKYSPATLPQENSSSIHFLALCPMVFAESLSSSIRQTALTNPSGCFKSNKKPVSPSRTSVLLPGTLLTIIGIIYV